MPRYRYDQLMAFGWKLLFPASVLNLIVTAALRALLQCLRRSSSTSSPGVAIVASALVIGQRNPMYSVMLLIASFGALSGLYIQLDAPFVAMAQIIVYAGAIMVLFLFVVMLLNAPQEDAAEWDRTHPLRRAGVGRFGALLAGLLIVAAGLGADARQRHSAQPVGERGDVAAISSVARARPRALHRLHVRVRSHVDPDPGGDGRRGLLARAGAGQR